jgi:hypothetical protein
MRYDLPPEIAERLETIIQQDGYLRPNRRGAKELYGGSLFEDASTYELIGPRKRRPGPKSITRKEKS